MRFALIILSIVVVDVLLFAIWQLGFTEIDQIHVARTVAAYYDAPTPQKKLQMDAIMHSATRKELYAAIACMGLIAASTLSGVVLIYREWRAIHLTRRCS